MSTFLLVMLAVIGMLMALSGLSGVFGEGLTAESRLVGWGLAICVAALTSGLRVLQRQIDELKADRRNEESPTEGTQGTQDVQPQD